jgi:hypothetical protein
VVFSVRGSAHICFKTGARWSAVGCKMRITDPRDGRRLQPWEEGYRTPREGKRLRWRLILLGLLGVAVIAAGYLRD